MIFLKKIFFIFLILPFLFFVGEANGATAKTANVKTPAKTTTKIAPWKAAAPKGYEQIDWAKARGIASFAKAPENNGHVDYLTFIYLPYNEIKIITTNTPRVEFGEARPPFGENKINFENFDGYNTEEYNDAPTLISTTTINTNTSTIADTTTIIKNWAFTKFAVEKSKKNNPDMKFMWNAPFFNMTLNTTDLTFALKSTDASNTPYITSGSRPLNDTSWPRKMLIINNTSSTAQILDFDEKVFVNTSTGDQGFEAFSSLTNVKGTDYNTERLFLGVKPNGKELVVYCSRGASPEDARAALLEAGVPLENQIQADGGNSGTCAYNMTAQYFVEPGRILPHLMGAFPFLYQAQITTDGLNVRNMPSPKGKSINKLKIKTKIKVFEEKNGWLRISQNQEWINASYVKKLPEA